MSLTAELPPRMARQPAVAPRLLSGHRVSVARDLGGLFDRWTALFTGGIGTPYQAPGWVAAYAQTVSKAEGSEVFALTIHDGTGQLAAVLPLEVSRRQGCRVAAMVGGKHANYQMPVMSRSFAASVTAQDWHDLLSDAALQAGIDAFSIPYQPESWDGCPNSLATLNTKPSPSRAYAMKLEASGDATLQRSLSAHARKKIRSKRNRFFEIGESSQWQALDEPQIERVLSVFLAQKALRFAAMGINNPFTQPGVSDFLRAGARTGAVELHALELDGDIVSCYVGAVAGGHFSGMATSFDPRDDLSKMSPGEILLVDLVHALCARRFTLFDLGVGDARYKATICDEVQTLHDGLMPVTYRGRVWCGAMRLVHHAKTRIMGSQRAMALINRFRRSKAAPVDQAGE